MKKKIKMSLINRFRTKKALELFKGISGDATGMKFKKHENNQALCIARVSSKRQEDNVSCNNQVSEMVEYCKRKKLEVVDVLTIVESAKNSDDRKEYKAAISKLFKGGYYNLVFYTGDREARNATDSEMLEKFIRNGSLQVHYVKEGKVFNKTTHSTEFLLRDINTAVNKQYSFVTGEKISAACEYKASIGWYPGNNPPLGYVNFRALQEDGSLTRRVMATICPSQNEFEISMVRREFELRAKGLSYREIRKIILAEGYPARLGMKTYNRTSIALRLKSPFYRGKFVWKGVEYDGNHEKIIDDVTLAEVNRLEGVFGKAAPSSLKNHSPLGNGFLKCADSACGCFISYDPKLKILSDGSKKTYKLYHCTNAKGVHQSLKGMSTNEDEIMKQFRRAVELVSLSEDFAAEISKALKEQHRRSKSSILTELDSIRLEIKSIEHKKSKLIEMRMNGEITPDELQIMKSQFEKDQSNKQKKIESLNILAQDTNAENAETILELAKDAKSLWEKRSVEDQVDFLKVILSNQGLRGVSVEFNLKTEWEVISKMNGNEKWSSLLDSNQ